MTAPPDAFGNALGESLAGAALDSSQQQQAAREANNEYIRELNRAKSTLLRNMEPEYDGRLFADDAQTRREQFGEQQQSWLSGGAGSGGVSKIASTGEAPLSMGGGLTIEQRLSQVGATPPQMLFGPGQQAILPGSYGGDYTTYAYGVSAEGNQQVTITGHRGAFTRADEWLQSLQDEIDRRVQSRQDEGAEAYARGDKLTAIRAAIDYLPNRLVGDTLKGVIGIPRLYTSNDMLPGLVNAAVHPLDTGHAIVNAVRNNSLQENVIQGIELLGPAALKFGPAAVNKLNALPVLGDTLPELRARAASLASGALENLAAPRTLRPQFGGLLIDPNGALGNSGVQLSATHLRNTPGVATVSSELAPASGRWLDATVPTPIPAQVGDALSGKPFNSFGDLRKAIWEEIGTNPELNSGFSRANLAKMNDGLAPSAPNEYLVDSGAFGDSFNLHHANPIENGGAVYDLSNLQIVSPKIHFDIHYVPN